MRHVLAGQREQGAHVVVVERVVGVSAGLAAPDQALVAERSELVGDGRLLQGEFRAQVVYAAFVAGDGRDDADARRVGQGLEGVRDG